MRPNAAQLYRQYMAAMAALTDATGNPMNPTLAQDFQMAEQRLANNGMPLFPSDEGFMQTPEGWGYYSAMRDSALNVQPGDPTGAQLKLDVGRNATDRDVEWAKFLLMHPAMMKTNTPENLQKMKAQQDMIDALNKGRQQQILSNMPSPWPQATDYMGPAPYGGWRW